MTLSYTVPCHQRQADLARVWPAVVLAAAASAPVELVLVDYANPESLDTFAADATATFRTLLVSSTCRLQRYRGRDHYHMAHARNLSIKAATGDYVVISSADICPALDYFAVVRKALTDTGAEWLVPDLAYVGVIVCLRQALIDAGGFDERFEFYGSEDKDLNLRLRRRKVTSAPYRACDHLTMSRTLNGEKIKHYRLPLSKTEMLQRGSALLKANVAQGVLVANEGQAWGAC